MMTPDTNDDSNSTSCINLNQSVPQQTTTKTTAIVKKRKNNDYEYCTFNETTSRSPKTQKRLLNEQQNENDSCKYTDSNQQQLQSTASASSSSSNIITDFINSLELADWLNKFQDWPNQNKLFALTQLIEQCDHQQILHVDNTIEPKLKRDYISELPRELQLLVLSYLSPKDLTKISQISNYWHLLADDEILWKNLCIKNKSCEFIHVIKYIKCQDILNKINAYTPPSPTTTNSHQQIEINNKLTCSTSAIHDYLCKLCKNYWKNIYSIDYNITLNWTTRQLPKPLVLRGHDEHVITCLKFDGQRIISGSDDCTLKVWCGLTGELIRTLTGHTGGVWSSQLKDNLLISGSTDRTVRVWNLDDGECLHVLTGHTSTVRCLALNERIVVSGSRDATLRVWDIESGKCIQILRGHAAAVRCVCFDGKYIISGSYDYTVRVWKPTSKECIHKLEGHTNRVYSLLFDGKRIVSGSLDTKIIVWDVESGRMLHELLGHQSLTSGMHLKDDLLVSGNADSTVKIWSISSGKCLHTLCGDYRHLSAVTCLVINDKFVISSSDDGTVKLWNIVTGEFIRNLLTLDSGGRGGVVWRISTCRNKLVCAVGSRMGTEETKLLLFDFDWPCDISPISSSSSTSSSMSSS